MRCPLRITFWIILISYHSLVLLVNAEGSFQLRLEKFVNEDRVDQAGKCCSSQVSSVCTGNCRSAVSVCLTHFQHNVNPNLECTFGRIKTPVVGGNSFSLMSAGFRFNPLQFNFTFRWPGSFSLIVDILHESENTTRSEHSIDSGVIISRLIKSGSVIPTKDNAWTRTIRYFHRNSVLHYSYRVVCGKYSYGRGCTKYCRPRDDVIGHYTCNENGDKVCMPGWAGNEKDSYCTEASCPAGCIHGSCESPNNCSCQSGWTGVDCSECETQPDCVHGTCENRFECNCLPGWGGHFCNQDLNYCVNNKPCKNGAFCSNTGQGSYTCSCKPGFVGKNCQIETNECLSHPCKNDATCVDLINDYQCVCPKNFFGRNCDKSSVYCNASPCQNGGVCINDSMQYHCTCTDEWTGVNCEKPINKCEEKCQNGDCKSTANGLVCVCKSGFTGTYCDKKLLSCSGPLCLNGGTCLDLTIPRNSCLCRRCDCPPRFSGTRCEVHTTTTTVIPPSASIVSDNRPVGAPDGYNQKRQGLDDSHVIVISNSSRSLNTTQWIAICLGSGVLVLLLVLSAGCLVYHRRKIFMSRRQRKFNKPPLNQSVNGTELAVVAEPSSPTIEVIKENNLKKLRKIEAYSSVPTFESNCPCESDTLWENFISRSENQRSVKNENTNEANSQRHVYQYRRHGTAGRLSNRVKEVTSHKQECHDISSRKSTNSESGVSLCCSESNFENATNVSRYSNSRLPTYEEVCEENDALLRQSYKPSKGSVAV